jgi:hypothetical protein
MRQRQQTNHGNTRTFGTFPEIIFNARDFLAHFLRSVNATSGEGRASRVAAGLFPRKASRLRDRLRRGVSRKIDKNSNLGAESTFCPRSLNLGFSDISSPPARARPGQGCAGAGSGHETDRFTTRFDPGSGHFQGLKNHFWTPFRTQELAPLDLNSFRFRHRFTPLKMCTFCPPILA